jgi:hypothetical protein
VTLKIDLALGLNYLFLLAAFFFPPFFAAFFLGAAFFADTIVVKLN